MLWSSLNKFKLFTTYHNHVVRGGQLKIESFQAGSHMYNTKRLFLKTPGNILKYTNFIGRNVILNFHKIDISFFTFHKNSQGSAIRPSCGSHISHDLKKNIYENFKRKLLRGIVNVIKKSPLQRRQIGNFFYDEILNYQVEGDTSLNFRNK